jgi:predicted permease
LTTAVQSIFLYRKQLQQLILEKKYHTLTKKELTWFALKQDFTNPARLGLFIGAACAPVMGILGAVTGLMSNGWVLAAIGSTESIVAGITVILGDRINEWRFRRKLKKQILK